MNIDKANAIGKYLLLVVLVLNILPLAFASGNLSAAIAQLCSMAKTFLGVATLLMVILAGFTYAIGQVLGAETRARASVWATAMLTGAIIGALIYVITPVILATLFGNAGTFSSNC